MKSRSTSVIVAALAAMISASPAQAGGLKQVAEISIPGDPITDIGIMAIDQTTGLGYLADKTNKSVVVFDTKTDKFVSRIPGFVGRLKDGNASGPNGVVVVKGGAEVWVLGLVKTATVAIGRGENKGRTVTYHNVVRRWVKLGDWNGKANSWSVPLQTLKGEGIDEAAVLVQSGTVEKPKAILGATLAAIH